MLAGEALYRFLLSMAQTPPQYNLNISGRHHERRTRTVQYTDSNGNTRSRQESYTVTIIDFDFYVSLTHLIEGATPVLWTVADATPAYRGTLDWEIDSDKPPEDVAEPEKEKQKDNITNIDLEKAEPQLFRREASEEEVDGAKTWWAERTQRGLPPWIGPHDQDAAARGNFPVLRSTNTIRDWADAYCASNRKLKEFIFTKVRVSFRLLSLSSDWCLWKQDVYGWDNQRLTEALERLIRDTGYTGTISVDFLPSKSQVIIRSASRLSRALDNIWIFLLLCVTLIYPFIAIWKRFSSKGGGKWRVCGAAYALKTIRPPTAEETQEPVVVTGEREGAWFRRWEKTIRHAVITHRNDTEPLMKPDPDLDGVPAAIAQLDGY
jgi:hypothetical protein